MKGSDYTISQQGIIAAAHELKAPLILMRHLVQSLGDEQLNAINRQQYLERLAFTTNRMLRLTQDLTLSYRMDDNVCLALEPLNITVVCEQALHEMYPYAIARGQKLCLNTKKSQLVLAHKELVHDIVVNLVDNAIHHCVKGDTILVGSQAKGSNVRLSVHDNGQPILRSEVGRLSKTIGTQPQPLSGRSGTSGLGLYIVSQFAQAMGGGLGVGRPTVGATFFVDFMRSQQLSLL